MTSVKKNNNTTDPTVGGGGDGGSGGTGNRLLSAPEILQLMNLRAKRACDVYTVVPDLERCGGADTEGAVTEAILKAIRPLCPARM